MEKNNLKIKKPFYKKWWVWVLTVVGIFVIAGFIPQSSSTCTSSTNNEKKVSSSSDYDYTSPVLTDNEKQVLKKHYKDFKADDIDTFTKICRKYNDNVLSKETQVKIKDDIERIKKERKEEQVRLDKDLKEAEEKYKKENTKDFVPGTYTVGKDIKEGIYLVTFKGTGNFIVNTESGSMFSNEIADPDSGITKYKATFLKGSKIQLSGIKAKFTPYTVDLKSNEFTIHAGYWIAGHDFLTGRYEITTSTKGSGNFIVYSKNGSVKANEILDENNAKIMVDLDQNDIVMISGLNEVKFKSQP